MDVVLSSTPVEASEVFFSFLHAPDGFSNRVRHSFRRSILSLRNSDQTQTDIDGASDA